MANEWTLGQPVQTDETNNEWVLGQPYILVEEEEAPPAGIATYTHHYQQAS